MTPRFSFQGEIKTAPPSRLFYPADAGSTPHTENLSPAVFVKKKEALSTPPAGQKIHFQGNQLENL